MTTLFSFLAALAILVTFHEFGHYWVARRCGVKVLRFSLGFGRVIYSKRFAGGETEWVISAIPLGGYVKMLDEREGEVAPHELARAFNRKSVAQRMAIVVAGPVANLILAVGLYWLVFMHGVPGLKPVLGEIAVASPAASAQLHPQETILRINGLDTPSWQEVRWILLERALNGGAASLEIRGSQGDIQVRELSLNTLTANDLDSDFLQKLGLQPYFPPVYAVIGELVKGGVGERVGLQVGDKVLRADGHELTSWKALVEEVRGHAGTRLRLEIERAGAVILVELTPDSVTEAGAQVGKIGAAPKIDQAAFDALRVTVNYAALPALREAIRKTWQTSAVSLQMMGKMVLGEVSLKNLSGPITIADYAGQSAQMGLSAYLGFLALISISLGVLNLLPVPLLDGGHLLYYAAEFIKGSPVSDKLWEVGQNVGIALLGTMMCLAMYNDIHRLISGL
jgi:regulator of sigma E protease